jgi:hypothetical protein
MKKLLIISALVIAGALSVHAQGRVAFASAGGGVNSKFIIAPNHHLFPSNAISLTLNPTFRADLFWAPGSTTVGVDASTLTGQDYNQAFSTVVSQYGYFTGGTKTVVGWTSGPIVAQVRVWDTVYGTYDQAAVAQGGSYFASGLFIVTPTTGTTPAPFLVGLGNPAGYVLNYNPIPEPTTFTLAGLGAAAMLIFRRRRK